MNNFRVKLLWAAVILLFFFYGTEGLRSETNGAVPGASGSQSAPQAVPVAAPPAAPSAQQVRNVMSTQDDPSLILEPIPTPTPTFTPSPTPTSTPTPKPTPTPTPTPPPLKPRVPDRVTEAPPSVEVAIILHNGTFYPSKIRLKDATRTKLYFATINDKPAALIIERLQIQRWIAKEDQPKPTNEIDRAKFELTRELSRNRITEIQLETVRGNYTFHDALSGARGQIVVE